MLLRVLVRSRDITSNLSVYKQSMRGIKMLKVHSLDVVNSLNKDAIQILICHIPASFTWLKLILLELGTKF